ncbi:prolow-density lipoprotein receptor-related protein 1-like [Mytilus edulis]|uniref:prolow-density lipoprotein receptor-related protein 1-like n=1 Tax=Mytilus edulis TaxID=6550 RepID=UPI0039F14DDE
MAFASQCVYRTELPVRKTCIPMEKVCDGKIDRIKDASDEKQAICKKMEPCSDGLRRNSSICQQKCISLPYKAGVYKCVCKEGYTLMEDVQDLCKKWGTCPQLCSQKHMMEASAGVHCSCEDGYEKKTTYDGTLSCIAKGPQPLILVARESVILQSDLYGKSEEQTIGKESSEKITGIDADMTTSPWSIFVVSHSNQSNHSISKMTIQSTKPEKGKVKRATQSGPEVLRHNLGNPHGIAVNWIGKHIYWTDSHTRKIEMANFEGKQRRSVISSALDQPYSIVVHPEKGKLFWTDRGFPPKIESSNLDGSGRKVVINEEIIWPNGLAIDYPNGRLYWADTKKRTIETVDLQGNDRHVVIQFNTSTGTLAPYMVDVFEDYLFVSFYHNSTVMKIKKFRTNPQNLEDGHMLFKTLLSIGDILILQPSKQKLIDNQCDVTDLHCPSAMCINMPQENTKKYKCVCPDGARYIDEKCDFSTCLPGHCYNGGTCNISNTGPKCICPPGYNGTRCNNYICNNYCQNGGQCMIHDGKQICRCPEMFTGATCSKPKNPSLCKGLCENGGTCVIMNGRRTCKCQKGFTGTRCEQCTSLMCYNGGTCRHSDSNSLQRTCVNEDCYIQSAVYCVCQSGYDPASQCSTASCKNYTCSVNQVCKLDKEGLPQCVCKEGYSGDKCDPPVVESHCEKGCKNGGTCKLKANSIDYACSCPPHYGGTYCQTAENICAGHCSNNGTCLLVNNSPKCSCNEYFTGSKCETCLCLNNGICKSDQNKFYCSCPGNYSGKICNASACGDYCFNDGQCTKCNKDSSTGRYKCSACSCTNGFGGERCETHASAHSQAQSSDMKQMITIVVPVVIGVVLILVILLIVILYRRRRDQFKHQRMHNSNMEINNPIYRQPVDGEIEGQGSEIEPLDMEGGDHNTNFANPMYARLYTTDSTQVLLPKDSDSEEALDKNGDLNFYGSKGNPKKSNF